MFLKEFREKIGLSQKEFAMKLGITQVTIARYETNKMHPTSTVLQKYINVFEANPIYLFTGMEPIFLEQQIKINKEYLVKIKEIELIKLKDEIRNQNDKN